MLVNYLLKANSTQSKIPHNRLYLKRFRVYNSIKYHQPNSSKFTHFGYQIGYQDKIMITDRAAKALKLATGKKTASLTDGRLILQLRKDVKTWRYRYTSPLTKKRPTINIEQYPALSVKEAYKKKFDFDEMIANRKDPQQEQTIEEQESLDIKWLAELFLEKDLKRNRAAVWQPEGLLTTHVIPGIGNHKLNELTTQHITALLDNITTKGHAVTSNKVLSIIKQMLSFAVRHAYLKTNVASNLTQRDAGGREEPRERNLSFDEIKLLLDYLDGTQHRISDPVKIMLKLLILTGQRTGDWLHSDWLEFDLDNKLWTIPKNRYKTGIEHKVPLTSMVLSLLKKLPSKKGQLFTLDSKAASRAIRRSFTPTKDGTIRLDLPHFTVHDIRRTVASRMSDLKVDAVTIEKILGHKLPKILQSYNRGEMMEERKAALEAWSDKIQKLIDKNIDII